MTTFKHPSLAEIHELGTQFTVAWTQYHEGDKDTLVETQRAAIDGGFKSTLVAGLSIRGFYAAQEAANTPEEPAA